MSSNDLPNIFAFYLMAGVPFLLVLLVIMVVFRPLYIVLATGIYLRYAQEKDISAQLDKNSSGWWVALAGVVVLIAIVLGVIFLRNELGIPAILNQKTP